MSITVLFCSVLYCTLHYTVLYCTVLYLKTLSSRPLMVELKLTLLSCWAEGRDTSASPSSSENIASWSPAARPGTRTSI